MAEVDLVAQDVNVSELPHIFFALIRRERRVAPVGGELGIPGVEFLTDFRELHLDAVGLLLLAFGVAEVGDEVVQAARLGGHINCLLEVC